MARDGWKYALLLLLMAAPLELTAFVAGRFLAARGVLYVPPAGEGYVEYLARRDPLLGWPAPADLGHGELDAQGARLDPGGPAGPACAAVFGDSFTFGHEVAGDQTYAHYLGLRLGCRVANYGVGGYGTDQALLRFRERFHEPAGLVVLAHYSENVIRNVNRYRGFLTGGRFGWKPRFALDGAGRLELLPMPEPAPGALARFGRDGPPLAGEFFWPGGPAGIVSLEFPYSFSMARLLGHYRLRARLEGRPSYEPFYDADHASGALAVTSAILAAFVEEAGARGQRPVVMVIPDEQDLVRLGDGRGLPYQALLDALAARGIETPGLDRALRERLAGRPPCDYFVRCGGGHMNAAGHEAIAAVLADWLAARGWAPGAGGSSL
jgi:hypothetical protein